MTPCPLHPRTTSARPSCAPYPSPPCLARPRARPLRPIRLLRPSVSARRSLRAPRTVRSLADFSLHGDRDLDRHNATGKLSIPSTTRGAGIQSHGFAPGTAGAPSSLILVRVRQLLVVRHSDSAYLGFNLLLFFIPVAVCISTSFVLCYSIKLSFAGHPQDGVPSVRDAHLLMWVLNADA